MPIWPRRRFLQVSSAALLSTSVFARGDASDPGPLGLPLGLQLYSVRNFLPRDFAGTLQQVASLGYREVEAAGFYGQSLSEVRDALQNTGLNLVSSHYSYSDLHQQLDQVIAFNKPLGVRYIVCSSPGFRDPSRVAGMKPGDRINAFTLDDWRWNAEQFNDLAKKVQAAGLRFAYHNHTMEFRPQNGVVPYFELLRLTDPSLVTMEMDCGWVVVGGGNPVEILKRYPTRISMLHVKDFKYVNRRASIADPPPAAELGRGTIDYRPIFRAAAEAGSIRHCFVEQEEFDMPAMEALRIDATYMHNLNLDV